MCEDVVYIMMIFYLFSWFFLVLLCSQSAHGFQKTASVNTQPMFQGSVCATGHIKNVRKIHLEYNNLKELKVRDFSGLPNLKEVIVSSSGVEKIDTNIFISHMALKLWTFKKTS